MVLTACASSSQSLPLSATLAADPASQAALRSAVSQALDAPSVQLADDALTTVSVLIIEPVRVRDAGGRLMQGRETRAPEELRLQKRGEECVLVQVRTSRELVLQGASCSPVE
jgi:hypothetical protein